MPHYLCKVLLQMETGELSSADAEKLVKQLPLPCRVAMTTNALRKHAANIAHTMGIVRTHQDFV
jgi:hypothetical protein